VRALVLASLQRGFNPAVAKDLVAAYDKLLENSERAMPRLPSTQPANSSNTRCEP
jgi:hypothetical protein